jgi:catechol 2,3-dioxygenase-like lactoylglutathione lyase family enzyme
MFSYATLGSLDFVASSKFFDAVLGVLGHQRLFEYPEGGWIAYGTPARKDDPDAQLLWLCRTPFDQKAASPGNGTMLSFKATTRAQVDACHAAALANGGASEGAPGIREAYGPDMYLAYMRDPTGNKFSVVTRGA